MPETTDLQDRFDALAGDVGRLAPGDADRPVRIARRRRRTRAGLAVAAAAAVVAGVAGVGLVGQTDKGDGDGVDAVDTGRDDLGRSGPLGRESLLRWLPADSSTVYVADIEAMTGTPGIDVDDPFEVAVAGFVESSLLKLNIAPFGRQTSTRLLTFVSNHVTEYRVLDLGVGEVEGLVRSAGWEPAGGDVWEAGADVGTGAERVARFVRIQGTQDGPTLLMTGREREALPDVLGGDEPPGEGVAARRLIEAGGGAGFAMGDFEGTGPWACAPVAVTLDSPTTATALLYPPEGAEPDEVTAEQITSLDGVTGVIDRTSSGDALRARVEIENPSVPAEIFQRLGLPGTEIC